MPTAFQKMRANRGTDAAPSAPPRPLEVLRANRRRAGEVAVRRNLVRKINRIEDEMAAHWRMDMQRRLAAVDGRDTSAFLEALTGPAPQALVRRIWWWPFRKG